MKVSGLQKHNLVLTTKVVRLSPDHILATMILLVVYRTTLVTIVSVTSIVTFRIEAGVDRPR
jgi:hypothetical protein